VLNGSFTGLNNTTLNIHKIWKGYEESVTDNMQYMLASLAGVMFIALFFTLKNIKMISANTEKQNMSINFTQLNIWPLHDPHLIPQFKD
jgi:hypothetical protein